MLGISFRIFCGLCDSEVDFRSLGVILVVLGWLVGCILSVLGSWGAIEGHFGGLGVALGGSGGTSERLRLKRTKVHFSSLIFN